MRSIWIPLLAALALAGCTAEAAEHTAAVGRAVPAYSAPTLAGDTVSLASLRGRVVLLNVWATWCPPCRDEMPGLQALQRELGPEGLRVVGVSVDDAAGREDILRFRQDYGISFTLLHDPAERVARTFRTTGVPETFLIDRDGVLVKHWIGRLDTRSPTVVGTIRAALSAPRAR